jgi:hypothetical protein
MERIIPEENSPKISPEKSSKILPEKIPEENCIPQKKFPTTQSPLPKAPPNLNKYLDFPFA